MPINLINSPFPVVAYKASQVPSGYLVIINRIAFSGRRSKNSIIYQLRSKESKRNSETIPHALTLALCTTHWEFAS